MQATDVDDGHTFSPALREQQKEVAELHARLPVLAAEGVAEFDRLYAEGFGCTTPEEAREILSMPAENADRILGQLDPQVPLRSLVTDFGPYENLEPIGGGSLEMKPKELQVASKIA